MMDFETTFSFLKKLARNNNREWFERNKPEFLEIKSQFEDLIADIYPQLVEVDESLAGQDPKKFVFRIYRDVRFSKDKKPYKTFLSAGISPSGRGMGKPGYYVQLEPGDKSFVCTGLYSPPPDVLAKVRQEIDYNGDRLDAVITDKKFRKNFPEFWLGDALKTMPKRYAKDHPHAAWLKMKSFVVMRRLTDMEIFKKSFPKNLVTVIQSGKPLNSFLTEAMD
jgi:uncharacterized protein (TIGR02453 family)